MRQTPAMTFNVSRLAERARAPIIKDTEGVVGNECDGKLENDDNSYDDLGDTEAPLTQVKTRKQTLALTVWLRVSTTQP